MEAVWLGVLRSRRNCSSKLENSFYNTKYVDYEAKLNGALTDAGTYYVRITDDDVYEGSNYTLTVSVS